MNILVLPLYRRADAMQENARDTEAKLHDGAAHIKKTFSGDEQMMILQTYYRQNHYKPTDALSGSVSLLLEIPFFIAAYQFLSHLEIFQGLSLGPIADLSAPDGLLVIGGVSVNLLPILMTLINVVSSALYLKGFPLKTKIQLYGMALLFLIFLYASPACLVFYWTLNNIFSLVKNIFYKLKNPRKTLRVLCAGTGAALLGFGVVFYHSGSLKRRLFLLGVGLVLLLPLLFPTLKKALPLRKAGSQPNPKLFLLSTVFLTVLIGLLIPSALIADSPQEFVDITCFHHPLWYIASTFCMAAGTFLIWTRMFYWLASPAGKGLFGRLIWILCGAALVNYLFFGTDLGVISSSLQYDDGMSFSMRQKLMNLLILTVAAAVLYFIARKWKRTAANILIISIVALGAMSAWNLFTIKASVDAIPAQQLSESDTPHFRLSTTGKNVIVLMLDRAMGEYIPYLFNEKPELKEKFDGFTYYENTISFGGSTIFGAPPLFGGYEYTPVEMNRREEVPLISKHNESLKVMPAVFSENGYEVTVCDPPYANYQGIPDLSIYDDCPGVTAYIAKGRFATSAQKLASIEQNHRNFFCFSVMKAMPLFVQPILYDKGLYIQFNSSVV
ncbi:MAG: YidC/Oxa1 family membrane protein insertase, partial [Acutalibacter sp.]|nr:YidC/Oxa1 family membrane protein insertase [Acutalibacter sp.]